MLDLCDAPILTDTLPVGAPHNISARILRHGLAVNAFASLEKYIASRFDELATRIQSCRLPFNAFGQQLQTFFSRDAATGLLNQVNFLDDSLKQSFFDSNVANLAGYLSKPVVYTAFGFSPRGSNVSHEDIKRALSAMGMKDPWKRLAAVTVDIGAARLSLVDDYRNLAKTRNRSAHDPESNVPSSDLKIHIETAVIIGIAVDVLTTSLGSAFCAAHAKADLEHRISTLSYSFRFLDLEAAGTLVERASVGGRVVKRYRDEEAAILGAAQRIGSAHVIVRSPTTTPLALA